MKVGRTPSVRCIGSELPTRSDARRRYKDYPVGYKSLLARLGYEDCLSEAYVDDISLAVVHEALIESGFPIAWLEMGHSHSGVPFSVFATADLPDAYQHLHTLTLELSIEQYWSDGEEGNQQKPQL